MYIKQSDNLTQKVNSVIIKAESLKLPIVYIRQENSNWLLNFVSNNELASGQQNSELDGRVKVASPHIFAKEQMDAFRNPDFDQFLKDHGIANLVLVSLDAAYCVNRTAFAAANRGYKVVIVENAVISESDFLKIEMIESFKSSGMQVIGSESCSKYIQSS